MRKFLSLLLIIVFVFGLITNDAQAKRFGGGRNFGMQRSVSHFSRPQSMNMPLSERFAAKKWLAPLTGLLIGGLLASLFMGHGLSSAILSWLGITAMILLIVSLLKRRRSATVPWLQTQRNNEFMHNIQNLETSRYAPGANLNDLKGGDNENFLRDAKAKFIRLQAAYDEKNLNDIRQFTTPEVFAEIQLQLQERGNETNYTEVISLHANLVDFNDANRDTRSVNFSGSIRESKEELPVTLKETWHFVKDSVSQDWKVAGIQQN